MAATNPTADFNLCLSEVTPGPARLQRLRRWCDERIPGESVSAPVHKCE